VTGLKIEVRTLFPRHSISRGRPTWMETIFPLFDSLAIAYRVAEPVGQIA
jgi:hypothetical protein